MKGCGASFSPGVQDLIHPHAVNDVCCNAYATIPQYRICYVRYRQALPTQNGRLVHKVFIFANPDCMPSIRQLGLVEVHWCSTLAVLHRIARPKGRPCCGYSSTQQGCVQSLTCLTLSDLDCDMSGLGAGDGGQSTTCR